MNEAFRLGLNDLDTMDNISHLSIETLQYKSAAEALEYQIITIGGVKNIKRLSIVFKEVKNRIR